MVQVDAYRDYPEAVSEPRQTQSESSIFGPLKASLFSTLFLQRLGFNFSFPFPIATFVTPVALALLLVRGVARITQPRLVLFSFVFASFLISMLVSRSEASLVSGVLFIFLYAMFVVKVDVSRETYLRYIRMIANTASVIAVIGVLQYGLQFVIDVPFLFSWRDIIPEQFLIEYNTLNETRWGSGVYKANGFFLLEASIYSQLAARALILAIFILRDLRYLIPFGLAMVVAYSGTGLTLFILFGIPALVYVMATEPRYRIYLFAGAALAPIAVILAWEPLGLQLFVDRIAEFGQTGSSAYARFVSGFRVLNYVSAGDPVHLFFGNGPGVIEDFLYVANSEAFGSTWIKLLVEYGFFGFFFFSLFFWACVRESTQSTWLATGFLLHFLFLDGGLVLSQQVATVLLLYVTVCSYERINQPRHEPMPFGDYPGYSR